jgi:transcriptional regulator with XRE-family HTH domain
MPGEHEDLKRAIRAARSNAGIRSDQELALRSGVHLQTLQNWMYGKTTPRPSELSKVAATLDVPFADLMAIYEGRDPEPPPLQDAIRELVEEMRVDRRERHESTMAMLQLLQGLITKIPRLTG